MTTTLKQKALHGAFWSFTERFGLLGVQFIVSIILARLLSPSEFGLLGMITVFTLLAQVVVESGFGQALIQKQDANHTDESTAFWFNLLAGLLMTLCLFFSAPMIATFYHEPLLEPMTRAASFNMLINSFGVVQNALIQKELLFKKRSIASLVAIFSSGLLGIIMAANGYGVWSLIAQILANNLLRTVLLWVVHPWRPLFVFSTASFSALLRFGSNMLFSGLTNAVFNNIYLLVIGKLYSAEALGYYQKAKEFIIATSNSIAQVVAQVNFPVLAKLQNDPTRMREAFKKIMQSTLFLIIPSMFGLGMIAPQLVPWLLGEKWSPSVPYLQILCIIGAFFPIHLLNLNILMATGRSDIYFRLEIIKKILTCVSISITYRYGVFALLIGQLTTNILSLLLNSHFTHKALSYGLFKQLRDNIKVLSSSIGMGCIISGLDQILKTGPFTSLCIKILIGVASFLLFSWIMKDAILSDIYRNAVSQIRKKI